MLQVIQSDGPAGASLYAPAGAGPFPAVLLLHGSEGGLGWLAHRAGVMFAAHGFLALPLAYDRGGNFWIGGDIQGVEVDRTEQAALALRGHPLSNGRLGVYGWSRGAEHALLFACLAARDGGRTPDAVAVHAPPDRVAGTWRNLFQRDRDEPTGERPGKRPVGRPVEPPTWRFRSDRLLPGLSAWSWRGRPLMEGDTIPVEAYAGPMFLSVGGDDELWPADMAGRLAARRQAAGLPVDYRLYPGQPHMPDPAGWNAHFEQVLGFLGRHLGPGESAS